MIAGRSSSALARLAMEVPGSPDRFVDLITPPDSPNPDVLLPLDAARPRAPSSSPSVVTLECNLRPGHISSPEVVFMGGNRAVSLDGGDSGDEWEQWE